MDICAVKKKQLNSDLWRTTSSTKPVMGVNCHKACHTTGAFGGCKGDALAVILHVATSTFTKCGDFVDHLVHLPDIKVRLSRCRRHR